jgi:hypothetical protein
MSVPKDWLRVEAAKLLRPAKKLSTDSAPIRMSCNSTTGVLSCDCAMS